MFRERLRESLRHISQALHDPEAFAVRWHDQGSPYHWSVFLALMLTAILGTTTYGLTMGLLVGPQRMLECSLYFTIAAGIAWGLPLPALYILNSLTGSRLRASTTLLAVLVTTSWGGLAMIASITISWFFSAAVPDPAVVLVVHVVVFAGVGVAMADVFTRVMAKLEPVRGRAPSWVLGLVAVLGLEMFYAFQLFDFSPLMQLWHWWA
jgi:hypothetical protein